MPKWYSNLSSDFRTELNESSDVSYKSLSAKCNIMFKWLDKLTAKCPKKTIKLHLEGGEETEIEANYHWLKILQDIEELKDNFRFTKDLADGVIPQNEWDDYNFNGDLVGEFNGCLSQFYDICDTYVGKDMKFCFVEL